MVEGAARMCPQVTKCFQIYLWGFFIHHRQCILSYLYCQARQKNGISKRAHEKSRLAEEKSESRAREESRRIEDESESGRCNVGEGGLKMPPLGRRLAFASTESR